MYDIRMDQKNDKEEPSVDDILSSIKDVISGDSESSDRKENEDTEDDNIFELTDIIESDDDLDENTSSESDDDLTNALNPDDLSLDLIIKEAVKESLDDWFSRNLKTIVEESVKQEISKLFKKRN